MPKPWELEWDAPDAAPAAGLKPWEREWGGEAPEAPAKPAERNAFAVVNDTVIEIANAAAGGVASAAEFVAPGNRFSRAIQRDIIEKGEASQSDVVKAEKARLREEVEQADGLAGEAGAVGRYIVRNPLLSAAQAAGSFVGPGVAIKGAGAAARAVGAGQRGATRAGLAGGAAAGGAMAGGDAAGNAYDLVMAAPEERLRQAPQWAEMEAGGASPEQIREALAQEAARDASIVPALIGAAGGAIGAEKLFAGAGRAAGRASQALRTGAIEAAQEGVEEGVTQYSGQAAAAGLDPSIDPMKGVGAAATMGAALGGITGGGVGALSPRRPELPTPDPASEAAQRLAATTNVDDAIAAATELAGSLDEIDAAMPGYFGETVQPAAPGTVDADAPRRAGLDTIARQLDRQAELLGEAIGAPGEFERQSALAQHDVAREQTFGTPQPGPAADYLDLTPLTTPLAARQRLTVLRAEAEARGEDPARIVAVSHPGQRGAFAISRLPEVSHETDRTTAGDARPAPSLPEAQGRLESAALAGVEAGRRAEDAGRQALIRRTMEAIAARGGVASPYEARVVQEAGLGRPYDRIDESLAPPLREEEALTQATGIAVPRASGRINAAAHEAATSPRNARPEPTDAQKEAGNYAKGHVRISGMDVSIENPKGSIRRSKADAAEPWQVRMPAHYGYIRGSRGADGDHVDLFIGDRGDNGRFWVINQTTPDGRQFDEHKVVTGVDSAAEATALYKASFADNFGDRVFSSISGELDAASLRAELPKMAAPKPVGQREMRFSTRRERDLDALQHAAKDAPVSIVDPRTLPSAPEAGREGGLHQLSREHHGLAQRIARIYGKRLVVFDGGPKNDGFINPDDLKTIYLNVRSQQPHLVVLGHELLHNLRRDNEEAYVALSNVVARGLGEEGLAPFRADYGPAANLEELTADLVGNRFREEAFWQEVFGELAGQVGPTAAPNAVMRLGSAVVRAVNAAKRALRGERGFRADAMIDNLEDVRKAVVQAMRSYAASQRGQKVEDVDQTPGTDAARESPRRGGPETDRREAPGERPRYGTPREGAIAVRAVHYGRTPHQALSSAYYGAGLAGAEIERLRGADPRLSQRIYFYVDMGRGIQPEAGVGPHQHEVDLANVYDAGADPLFLKADAATVNDFEVAVLDAGFDGYFVPDFRNDVGAAVLLGRHIVRVSNTGVGAQPPSGEVAQRAAKPVPTGWRAVVEGLNSSSRLPGGELAWSAWPQRVQQLEPQLYEAAAASGLWEWAAQQDGRAYRDELVRRYREMARGERNEPADQPIAASTRRPEAGGLPHTGIVPGGARALARDYRADPGIDLQGAPGAVEVPGVGPVEFHAFGPAQEAAVKYMTAAGLPYNPPRQYVRVDRARATRIAEEYDRLQHAPDDPAVKRAYDAMVRETVEQYRAVLDTGLQIEFIDYARDGDPYAASPRLAIMDVVHNNHLWVFSTRDGYGTDEFDTAGNPMLAETEFQISGQTALVNDLFRVVHDYFGHIKDGVGFRADGEENAWRSHSAMYSALARRAMTTETRAQNSWVNYGPWGEQNRTAGGAQTHYADQKIGLMPEWVSSDGLEDFINDLPGEGRGFREDRGGARVEPSSSLDGAADRQPARDRVSGVLQDGRGATRARAAQEVRGAQGAGRMVQDQPGFAGDVGRGRAAAASQGDGQTTNAAQSRGRLVEGVAGGRPGVGISGGRQGEGAGVLGENLPQGSERAGRRQTEEGLDDTDYLEPPGVTASTRRPFYSELSRQVDSIKTSAAPAAGWKDAIKGLVNKGAVKADEVEWSGLREWLDLQTGRVTKQQVVDYLQANGVQVDEVVLQQRFDRGELDVALLRWANAQPDGNETAASISRGDSWDQTRRIAERDGESEVIALLDRERNPAQYGQYTLPGGERYREVLLTLPKRKVEVAGGKSAATALFENEMAAKYGGATFPSVYNKLSPDEVDRYEMLRREDRNSEKSDRAIADRAVNYQSGHWRGNPNVLAHLRVDDRTDAAGRKVLFIEEIQSDWAQEGKRKGFQNPSERATPAEIVAADERVRLAEEAVENASSLFQMRVGGVNDARRRSLDMYRDRRIGDEDLREAQAFVRKQDELVAEASAALTTASGELRAARLAKAVLMKRGTDGLPEAPFVGKTEAWVALALKRAIKMAVDGGYDAVALVNGQQSADRYDLSKQVDQIRYIKNADGTFEVWASDEYGGSLSDETDKQGLTPNEIADFVGKDVADRIVSGKGREEDGDMVLEGLDLQVGGEGMRTFYDRIVPNTLRDVLKKLGGGNMKTLDLPQDVEMSTREIDGFTEQHGYPPELGRHVLTQPGFDITPTMRERAAEGLPLFSTRRPELPDIGQEHRATLTRIAANLTPAERDKLNRGSAERLVERVLQLPSANEMAAVAFAGRAKRGWYRESAEAIANVFGPDAPLFARLLAALSPQTSVELDLRNTLSTWKNWVAAGRPTDPAAIRRILGRSVVGSRGEGSVLPAWVPNAVRALNGRNILSGPKVNSFALNLLGDVDEVTNDAWMANYALVNQAIFSGSLNIRETDPGKGTGYLAMSAQVRAAAKKLTSLTGEKWTPAEVQETIWSWAKTLYEQQVGGRTAREVLAAGGLTDDLLRATPDFRTLFHDETNEAILRDAGYADQLDALGDRAPAAQDARAAPQTGALAPDAVRRQENRAAARLEELKARGEAEPDEGLERGEVAEDIPFSTRRPEIVEAPRRNIYGRVPPARWQVDEGSRLDDLTYSLQDKQIDTRRVVDAVRKAAGSLDDHVNPYLNEELYHGRAAKRTKNFLDRELRPLLIDMKARGVTMEQLEEYLWNRHAEERNAQIARINPRMPDAGSGIKTADAAAYLAQLDPRARRHYEALAARVDAMTAKTRQAMVSYGLEQQSTIDAMESAYSSYVPLFREEMDNGTPGTGAGFSVRGPASKRAMGSLKPVEHILAQIALQRERVITRGEKNRVGNALYGLALRAPNTDYWMAINPAAKLDPASQARLQAELVNLGLNPIDAEGVIREPVQRYIDPRTGMVAERVNPLLRSLENVVATRVDGQDRYIFFNESNPRAMRMARALKNLDADQLGRVLGTMGAITRWMAAVNTQYNPVFGIYNFLRDVQGAVLQLSTTPLAGAQKEVLGHTLAALRGVYIDARDTRAGKTPRSSWAQLYEQFQSDGGQTGFRDLFATGADRAEALRKELDPTSTPLGRFFTAGGRAKAPFEAFEKGAKGIFGWLSDYNEAVENSVRLAAYKTALDRGISRQQAASIAKNLTVNFNRKGQIATQAGAMYAFFNAAVQGSTRLGQTLAGPAGRKIVAGGLLLGVLQALALAAAGFKDEPPEGTKERSLIIPLPEGRYLAIPMPLGYHVIPSTSRKLTEWAMGGFRDTAKYVADMVAMYAEAFNPIGQAAGASMQTLAPTALDPLVALTENRDNFGRPIAREDFNDLAPTPGHTRAKDTASWFGRRVSEFLNWSTGGTDYQPGQFSPTPDQIDYLVGQATGGVGREILKAEQTVRSRMTGEELPAHKVPLIGRLYGETRGQAPQAARYYENIRRLNLHEAEIKGRRAHGEPLEDYLQEHPETKLVALANKTESQVKKLRRRKRELLERGASPEAVRMIEQQITARMTALNERVEALRD